MVDTPIRYTVGLLLLYTVMLYAAIVFKNFSKYNLIEIKSYYELEQILYWGEGRYIYEIL